MVDELRNSTVTFWLGLRFMPAQYLAMARNGHCTEYAPKRFHAIVMRVRMENSGGGDGGGGKEEHQTTATALVFATGRVVLTGGRFPNTHCPELLHVAARVRRRLAHSLRLGARAHQCAPLPPAHRRLAVRRLRVRNLVGSRRLPHHIALHPLARQLLEWRDGMTSVLPAGITHIVKCTLDQSSFPALRCTLRMTMLSGEQQQQQHHHAGDDRVSEKADECTLLVFASGRVIVTGVRCLARMTNVLDVMQLLCAKFPSPNNGVK